ncbi:MAG: CAP domain-containing protein [Lachnospiraceae bacterium]|nr:CAP domain-containing protein [Lachnospiraceae bacterium]
MKRRVFGLIMSAVMLFGCFGQYANAEEDQELTGETEEVICEEEVTDPDESVMTEEDSFMSGEPVAYEAEVSAGEDGNLSFYGTVTDKKTGFISAEKPSKEQLAGYYDSIKKVSSIYEQKPDVTAESYKIAKLSEDAKANVLGWINYYRKAAGLTEVTWSDEAATDAAYGALVLAMNDTGLSHEPPKPEGMSDEDYEKGYKATGSSNISYCTDSTGANVLKTAIQGQMRDDSSSNLMTLGHRRWLLYPSLKTTGIGTANNNSKYYTSVKVFGDNVTTGDNGDYDVIAWPASGYNLSDTFTVSTPWSVTLNPDKYTSVGEAKVTLKRESDGVTWEFSGSNDPIVTSASNYFKINTQYYGVPNCIIFRPAYNQMQQYSGDYTVTVSGVKDKEGNDASFSYKVNFDSYANIKPSSGEEEKEKLNLGGYDFSFTDIVSGETVKYDGDDGKPKLVMFAGVSSCNFCTMALRAVSKLVPKTGGKMDFYVFDIKNNTESDIKEFYSKREINKAIKCASWSGAPRSMYSEIHNYKKSDTNLMPTTAYVDGKGDVINITYNDWGSDSIKNNIVSLIGKLDDEEEPADDISEEVGVLKLAVKGKLKIGEIMSEQTGGGITYSKFKITEKSAPGVAGVNKKGVLTGKKAGKVKVVGYVNENGQNVEKTALEVTIEKPVFKFTAADGKKADLTYEGQTFICCNYVSGIACEDYTVNFSVPEKKKDVAVICDCTISNCQNDCNTSCVKANGMKSGTVKVSCTIGGKGKYADKYTVAKYTATIKVKLPKLKEQISIAAGKTKTVTLKNVSSYTPVVWEKSSGAAVELTQLSKANKVKITAAEEAGGQSAQVTAIVNDQRYTITVDITP